MIGESDVPLVGWDTGVEAGGFDQRVVVGAGTNQVAEGGGAAVPPGFHVVGVAAFIGGVAVESAWGAVSRLLGVRFPRPLAEPAVRVSTQRALHGSAVGWFRQLGPRGWGLLRLGSGTG